MGANRSNPSDEAQRGGNGSSREDGSPPTLEFATLILSMRDSTLLLLGVAEGPPIDVQVNHEAAKSQIDVLELLQSKTVGNLTDDEDQLLRTVLYELRLAYVDAREGA